MQNTEQRLPATCVSFGKTNHQAIATWMELYFALVYPLYPVFDHQTVQGMIQRQVHLSSRGLFASVMAACALVAATTRDGATSQAFIIPGSADEQHGFFLNMAEEAMPGTVSRMESFDFLRVCVLLALSGLQDGRTGNMYRYIGHYHTLKTMLHFEDEDSWPNDLPNAERQALRGLFWSAYKLDVLVALQFHSVPRSRELQSNVKYPCYITHVPDSAAYIWLPGWNFCTDLYRILEHLIERAQRARKQTPGTSSPACFLTADRVSNDEVLAFVQRRFQSLPLELRQAGHPRTHFNNFVLSQNLSIRAAMQLVSLVVFQISAPGDVREICELADRFVEQFSNYHLETLGNMACTLQLHLDGIGQTVAATARIEPANPESLQRIGNVWCKLEVLLKFLEQRLPPAKHKSKFLKEFLSWYGTQIRLTPEVKRYDTGQAEAEQQQQQQQQEVILSAEDSEALQDLNIESWDLEPAIY